MSQDSRTGSGMDQLTTSKVKEEWQSSLLSLANVNHMPNILLKYQVSESQAGIKVAGRNIKTLRYIDGNTETESEEEINSLFMRLNEMSEKPCWKLYIHKNKDKGIWFHHYLANRRSKHVETVTSFIFLASKLLEIVTAVIKLNVTCFWM